MDYKKIILNKLLDKFEKSKAYPDGGSTRRILLKFSSREFPEYDIEKPEMRELINSIVQELGDRGLVGFEWLKFERGNIVAQVWLNPDQIAPAYREAGRQPKSDRAFLILEMARDLKESVSLPWLQRYLEDTVANLEKSKSAPPYLPDDPADSEAVLKALWAINDQDNEECLERVFSLRCFGDSKFFTRRARKRVIGIIRNYLPRDWEGETPSDDEILAQVGIVRSPEQIEFCGGMEGKLTGGRVDFSVFRRGIAINSDTVKEIEIISLKAARKVLFIENKANYIDYILKKKAENELVIFHGGFYSPVKGLFFKKVYEAGRQAGVRFYHWGDLDVGGFRIFSRLKTNLIPELQPLLMDEAAFLSKSRYWISFDEKYGAVLEGMLARDEFSEFAAVIAAMLKVRSKLEQEAFL